MKKIITVILAGLLLFSMTACNKSDPQTVTLTIEDSGILGEYTIQADGDKINTVTLITTMDCTGYSEEQLALIEESMNEYRAVYEDIDGVVYDVGITDSVMIESLTLDTTKEDAVKELSDLGLLPFDTEDDLSLEKTVEYLEEQGWSTAETSEE